VGNDFLCENDSQEPTIGLERSKKAVGDASKPLEIATWPFRYFGLQLCFASWQLHWERSARTASERLWKRAACWMCGTRRCFIISYTHSRFWRLHCTEPSIAACAGCLSRGFCSSVEACICL